MERVVRERRYLFSLKIFNGDIFHYFLITIFNMFGRTWKVSRKILNNTRGIHEVPVLRDHGTFSEKGIQGLYSSSGYKAAWIDYQKYLTMNLTLLTNGSENEVKTPYQILLHTAKQTTEQHTFHFASQAHNNHFCFEQLTNKSEARSTSPSRNLLGRLSDQGFGGIEEFKNAMLSTANSAIGQGWVFLVEGPDKSLKILKCNNDGTPYYYGKNQSLDLNGGIDETSFDHYNRIKQLTQENERDFSLPILGINYWDSSYINDYGVNGKAEYLANYWDCINWNVVNKRLFQL